MADYSGYNQTGGAPAYTQPPGYSSQQDYQPLHQPVNNSYGAVTQEQPKYDQPQHPHYDQPQQQQAFPPYQENPGGYAPYQGAPEPQQPAYNPHIQYGAPPPPVQQPALNQYAPAPASMQQQNTNVVVVNQQPQPQTVIHVQPRRVNTYLTLSIVLMVICFIHGNLPFVLLLIPALICACVADNHRQAGHEEEARSCGQLALCCNVSAMVGYAVVVVAAIAVIIAVVMGVFASVEPPTYYNGNYFHDS